MTDELTNRLVSPNGFDGRGPVPDKVNEAARKIAKLRVRFVNQWHPGCEQPLTTSEVDALFAAAAIQAEWIRELYESRDQLAKALERAEKGFDWIAGYAHTYPHATIAKFALEMKTRITAALAAQETGTPT